MLASLSVEAIGHCEIQKIRLWSGITREIGLGGAFESAIGSPSDFERWGCWEVDAIGNIVSIVRGRTDYSHANSKGSRGVKMWYTLKSGRRYKVKAPQSWKNSDEYFCHVNDSGEIVRE